jgi:hypothetical protein
MITLFPMFTALLVVVVVMGALAVSGRAGGAGVWLTALGFAG